MSIGHVELYVDQRARIREYKTSKDYLSMKKEDFTDFQKEIGSGQWEVSRHRFEQRTILTYPRYRRDNGKSIKDT